MKTKAPRYRPSAAERREQDLRIAAFSKRVTLNAKYRTRKVHLAPFMVHVVKAV